MPNKWSVSKRRDAVELNIQPPKCPSKDWEQWVLLTSDRHWDNPHSDHDLQLKHLAQAKERNAPVLDFGDAFCLMQGRYDPRKSRKGIRPEHDVPGYIDAVVDTAGDFFGPYAKQLALITRGNHELSILKNLETDVLERFGERLRMHGGNPVVAGIGGWVLINVATPNAKKSYNRKLCGIKLAWHHGAGGGGPVTKGTIQANRRATYLPQADIVCSGHVHEGWIVDYSRDWITERGVRELRKQTHVCVPTYKDEYNPDGSSWHCLNGRPPKPIGCAWLRLFISSENDSRRLKWEVTISE